MTIVYVGTALFICSIVLTVITFVCSSNESRTVAKSLALIDRVPSLSSQPLDIKAGSFIDRLYEIAAVFTGRLIPSSASERLSKGLDRAGHPAPWTVERLMGAKGICAITGVLFGLLLGHGTTVLGAVFAVAFGALFFFLPDILIYNTALRRKDEILRGFAEAIDMLTICVEAGQGFDAAILEVARNVNGPIAGELARLTAEIQIGTTRGEAFRALGERTNLPEVKSFVTAISQADKLGIPIAAVLREQTSAMRLSRKQRAEAQAQKVTVKILFPLILCIFPALLVVILGPGGIRIANAFTRSGF